MSPRKPKSSKQSRVRAFPRESAPQQAEAASRRLLHVIFTPWRVSDEHDFDFGIDARVYITEAVEGGAREVPGHLFSVQLKALTTKPSGGTIALDLETRHLRSWRNTPGAVMVVAAVIPEGALYYRWIDDDLFAELMARAPFWGEQATVRVHLPVNGQITAEEFGAIRARVVGWRKQGIIYVPPGAYLRLYERAQGILSRVANVASSAGINATPQELEALEHRLAKSTYVVGLAGPSRVGKSSLLNLLVGKAVSPVDDLPTTGIPVSVIPDASDSAVVEFLTGESTTIAAAEDKVAPYVTKRLNPGNEKGVRRVVVHTKHPALQPGIALLDVPGLDDLEPEVRDRARTALATSSAVIYMMDGTPIKSGGVPLNSSVLEDLRFLAPAADRLLLVVNKCEDLSESDEARVRAWMDHELKTRGPQIVLRTPVIFGSVRKAAENFRKSLDYDADLGGLIRTLWGILLEHGNAGISRLGTLVVKTHDAAMRLSFLLQISTGSGRRASELTAAVKGAKERRQAILSWLDGSTGEQRTRVVSNAAQAVDSIATQFDAWLRAVPTDKPLPTDTEMQKFVAIKCREFLEQQLVVLSAWSASMQREIDRRVQDVLRDMSIRAGAIPIAPKFELPHVEGLVHEVVEALKLDQPFWGLVLGGLLDLWLGSSGLVALFGLLIGFDRLMRARRARAVTARIRKLKTVLPRAVGSIEKQIVEANEKLLRQWRTEVGKCLDGYIADYEKELSRAGAPLGTKEIERLEGLHATLAKCVEDLGHLVSELNQVVEARSA